MREWSQLVEDVEVCGLMVVGSLVRGEADHYSDLDFKRYWVGSRPCSHRLLPWGDRLLSLTDMGVEEARAQLGHPEGWVWAAGGFRTARVLHDPYGELEALRELAMGSCPEGGEWAVTQLEGWCEEAHKLLGSLASDDEEKAVAARLGLIEGMTLIAAVDLGLPIVTENRVFAEVGAAMPAAWREAQRAGLGGDTRAALSLFLETAARFPSTPVLELTLGHLRTPMVVPLRADDRAIYSCMRRDLWPDCEPEEVEVLLGPDRGLEEALSYRGFVAREPLSGEVLGLVELGEYADHRGHLEGLFVRPQARRRGVGRALVRWAVAELGRRGCQSITSDTWTSQEVSQRLHARCGFEEVERDADEVRYVYRGPSLWPSV